MQNCWRIALLKAIERVSGANALSPSIPADPDILRHHPGNAFEISNIRFISFQNCIDLNWHPSGHSKLLRVAQKAEGMKKAKEPMQPLDPDKRESPSPEERIHSAETANGATTSQETEAPAFVTLQKRPWMMIDLLRVLLILLSLAAAGGLVLVLLPQPSVERMVQWLQARHTVANPEQIAFLYLGHETTNNELHIRGVVRNITAMPIEKLDAIVRFYAHDGSLLETTVVRMSKETIGPNEIGQFDLVNPNYRSGFASYSVEFKLRQGLIVPYKDLRTMQARSN